jgi:hypothetical protein
MLPNERGWLQVAGRVFGEEPPQIAGRTPGHREGTLPLDWSDVFLDPTDWGNR